MRWLTTRWARVLAGLGYEYPVGYLPIAHAGFIAVAAAALVQRAVAGISGGQWWWLVAAALLAAGPMALGLLIPRGPIMLVFTAEQIGSVLLFQQVPVRSDAAPLLLVLTAVVTSAVSTRRRTLLILVLLGATLAIGAATGRAEQAWLFAPILCFAAVVGQMLQVQLRLLSSEQHRREQRSALERAAIAAEVHDVVAHSLSVVLLNVTAARRALTEDADQAEAAIALVDAERAGRTAMADIRSTISLLRADGGDAPAPGIADLDELIATFDRAGARIEFHNGAAPRDLTSAAELAAYRVVQESVSNAVRHAPGTAVRVEVGPGADAGLVVRVVNPVPDGARTDPGGSGLAGMRSRVENAGGRLSCGVHDGAWTVDARFPPTPERLAEARP